MFLDLTIVSLGLSSKERVNFFSQSLLRTSSAGLVCSTQSNFLRREIRSVRLDFSKSSSLLDYSLSRTAPNLAWTATNNKDKNSMIMFLGRKPKNNIFNQTFIKTKYIVSVVTTLSWKIFLHVPKTYLVLLNRKFSPYVTYVIHFKLE